MRCLLNSLWVAGFGYFCAHAKRCLLGLALVCCVLVGINSQGGRGTSGRSCCKANVMACERCLGCAGRSRPCSCSDVRPSNPLQILPRARSSPRSHGGFLCCVPKARELISKTCRLSSTGRAHGSGRTSKCRPCCLLLSRTRLTDGHSCPGMWNAKGVGGRRPWSTHRRIDRRERLSCPS